MGESVANLPISNSYVGLLRISSDATGVSSTPVSVYTSDGKPTALSLSDSSAIITGGLDVTDIITTKTIRTGSLGVANETLFENRITFLKASDEEPGVINETGVIFENRGTFKSTGTIISKGTANFTTLECTEDVSVGGNFTVTDIASFDSTQITFTKNFNCTQTASFDNVKLNNISTASGSGITVNSPTSFTGTLTTTNNTILGGSLFAINATSTTFNKTVTFKNAVALGSNVTATTQAANDNSTKVATTAYVDRAIASNSGGMIPDYSKVMMINPSNSSPFTAPTDGIFSYKSFYERAALLTINSTYSCHDMPGKYGHIRHFIPIGKGDIITGYNLAEAQFIPYRQNSLL